MGERERERGKERGGQRMPSRHLCADNREPETREPEAGFELRNYEFMT